MVGQGLCSCRCIYIKHQNRVAYHPIYIERRGRTVATRRTNRSSSSNRKRRRRRSGGSRLFRKILMVLSLFAALMIGAMVFFKVETVTVVGNYTYTQEQIVEVSGIEVGDTLFGINKFSVMQTLLSDLPYLTEVNITRNLPNGITITTVEGYGVASIYHNGQWWLVNLQGKLLERGDASLVEGMPQIIGITPLAPGEGTILAVGQEESTKLSQLLLLLEALDSRGMLEQVTEFIDLSSETEIRFGYGSELTVVVPLYDTFTDTLFALERVIQSYEEEQVVLRGTLDLTYGSTQARILADRWTPWDTDDTTSEQVEGTPDTEGEMIEPQDVVDSVQPTEP